MFHPANKLSFFPKKFLLLALLLFLLPLSSLRAAKNAIGIRVARNAEHLSPSEWYEKYAPSGSKNSVPSSISFAGYEAVSVGSCASGNGETIYVNATNIDNNNLYTNIYIIACPVAADQDIVDIFNQLIKNWDFNVNDINKSEQGKIQRDTKRLSDIATLNELLANYRVSNSRYPKLESGTYEIGKSISSWSSWDKTFGAQLQSKLPIPTIGQGWGALTDLENWTDSDGKKVWPKDMYFPTSVGIDYTLNGCRQITAVKDQKVVSWCEGGCEECGVLSYSTTTAWPTGTNPADVAVSYQKPKTASCRELFTVQNGKYSILEDNYSSTANNCPNIFSPATAQDLKNYISDWSNELKDPTAISRGIDYNNCEHIFVVTENRWSEYTKGKSCPYVGWTPIAELDTVPETFDIEWPEDVQNPDAIAMSWDKDGQRHIYSFKGNNYREYIDYNRLYVYQTNNQGLSYSLCAYFETAYSSLSGINCSEFQSSNYSPAIAKLTDQKVTIGNYFNYNITATDIDGDNLSWEIDLGCEAQTLSASEIFCEWGTSKIYAANTSQKNIKKIYGTAPDTVGTRTVVVTVADGRGGTDTKSFNLDVVKSDLVITSFPPADITIGDDYQYDVEAYDPQGYYPLTYSWNYISPSTSFPPGMSDTNINLTTGVIFGTPTNVGLYNVSATVKNKNNDYVTQNFKINVRDFSVVDIPDTEIPREHTINFFAKTNPEKVKKIRWSIACGSANADCDLTLPDDIDYGIDSLSGEITIIVNNSAALYDVFRITVTATSSLDGIGRSDAFDVMINNRVCGNGVIEAGEECDDGNTTARDGCEPLNCTWSTFSITSMPPQYLVAEKDIVDYKIVTDLIPPASISLNYTISGAPAGIIIDGSNSFNPKMISSDSTILNAQAGFYKITIKADYKNPIPPNLVVSSATQTFDLIVAPRYDLTGSFNTCISDGRCKITSLSATNDELKLGTAYGTKYLWLADFTNNKIYQISAGTENGAPTAAGTVVKIIDVGDSGCLSPSRTTIDFDGYAWIACRNSAVDLIRINPGTGIVENRFDVDPTCGARGVVVDKNNNIWVGCYTGGMIYQLDSKDSYNIDKTISTSVSIYGMALDKDGYIWVSGRSSNVGYVVNPANGKSDSIGINNLYGITADNDNHAWLAGWGDQKIYELIKSVDAGGNISLVSESHPTPDEYTYTRGMAIAPDPDNVGEMNIWTTYDSQNAVGLFKKDGTSLGTMTVSGSAPIGITATNDGTVWAVNYNNNSGVDINRFKQKIGCMANCIEEVGKYEVMSNGNFYSYSDMAGFALLNIVGATKGTWTLRFNSLLVAPNWTTLIWSGQNTSTFWGAIPTGNTSLTFRVKSAITEASLGSAGAVDVTKNMEGSFTNQVIDLSTLPDKQWLEVQIELISPSATTTPILGDVQVNFTQ